MGRKTDRGLRGTGGREQLGPGGTQRPHMTTILSLAPTPSPIFQAQRPQYLSIRIHMSSQHLYSAHSSLCVSSSSYILPTYFFLMACSSSLFSSLPLFPSLFLSLLTNSSAHMDVMYSHQAIRKYERETETESEQEREIHFMTDFVQSKLNAARWIRRVISIC